MLKFRACLHSGWVMLLWMTLITPLAAQTPSHERQAGQAADQARPAAEETKQAAAQQQASFAWLRKTLDNAQLVGHYTVDGRDTGPNEERYTIEQVEKLPQGDLWLFRCRIRYGDKDVRLPIPLPVRWAGSTPVISLDNLTIPGLGTFDARVLITQDKYAGTWRHGEVGGLLFGRIERAGQGRDGSPEGNAADGSPKESSGR